MFYLHNGYYPSRSGGRWRISVSFMAKVGVKTEGTFSEIKHEDYRDGNGSEYPLRIMKSKKVPN